MWGFLAKQEGKQFWNKSSSKDTDLGISPSEEAVFLQAGGGLPRNVRERLGNGPGHACVVLLLRTLHLSSQKGHSSLGLLLFFPLIDNTCNVAQNSKYSVGDQVKELPSSARPPASDGTAGLGTSPGWHCSFLLREKHKPWFGWWFYAHKPNRSRHLYLCDWIVVRIRWDTLRDSAVSPADIAEHPESCFGTLS